jgi:hypothetical protein
MNSKDSYEISGVPPNDEMKVIQKTFTEQACPHLKI